MDCYGVWGGTATHDNCGRCSGGTTPNTPNKDKDCWGQCFGPGYLDSCGKCAGPVPSRLQKSMGVAVVTPNRERDDCNVCVGTRCVSPKSFR